MEWIKTVDRLPDDLNKCWAYCIVDHGVYVEKYIEPRYYFNGWMGKRWYDGFDYDSTTSPMEQVTHWMPYYTPDPPTD